MENNDVGMERTLKEIRPIIIVEFGVFSGGVLDNKFLVHLKSKDYIPFEYNSEVMIKQGITHRQYRYNNQLFIPQ